MVELALNRALRATRPAGRQLSAHTLGGAALNMSSRRSRRRDRDAQRRYAEADTDIRSRGLGYVILALVGLFVAFMYGGFAAFGIGALVSLLVAAYFLRVALSRPRRSLPQTSEPASEQVHDAYERSLRERIGR
jgi:hypothetical protein